MGREAAKRPESKGFFRRCRANGPRQRPIMARNRRNNLRMPRPRMGRGAAGVQGNGGHWRRVSCDVTERTFKRGSASASDLFFPQAGSRNLEIHARKKRVEESKYCDCIGCGTGCGERVESMGTRHASRTPVWRQPRCCGGQRLRKACGWLWTAESASKHNMWGLMPCPDTRYGVWARWRVGHLKRSRVGRLAYPTPKSMNPRALVCPEGPAVLLPMYPRPWSPAERPLSRLVF